MSELILLKIACFLRHKNNSVTKKEPAIALKYENVASKPFELLIKLHQSQNDSATFLIMCHVLFLARTYDNSRFLFPLD